MGDIALVSVDKYEIPGVTCYDSLKNIDFSNVTCLIFHSSKDSEMDTALILSKLKGQVEKVIYINKKINPLYYCIFTGLDADIYDMEESLSDPSVIQFMIDNYKNTGMAIKPPSADVETLAKGIAALSSMNLENLQKLLNNDFWIRTLNTAMTNVDNALTRASQINIDVVEMLGETMSLIQTLERGNEATSRELVKLKQLVYELEKKEKPNSVFIFHTYHVPVTVKRVLYVRALGYCRYLNSFLLAYQHYLKMNKKLNSKVLFAFPKLKVLMQKYKDIPRLARDSIGMVDLRSHSYFITYEPQRMVLDEFFNQQYVDLFIVMDGMFGDSLLEGHMVETYYALSGISDLQRFDIPPRKAILSLTAPPDSILIPHINKYVEANEHTRRTMYFDKCSDMFKRLDDVLFNTK